MWNGTYLVQDNYCTVLRIVAPGVTTVSVPQPVKLAHVSQLDVPANVDNPGYFPQIFGLFWAVLDYLRLNPGNLPPMHRHIVIHCRCPRTGSFVSDGLSKEKGDLPDTTVFLFPLHTLRTRPIWMSGVCSLTSCTPVQHRTQHGVIEGHT